MGKGSPTMGDVEDSCSYSDLLMYPQDWDKSLSTFLTLMLRNLRTGMKRWDGEWEPPVIQNPEYKVSLAL